jgi:hypothetical protein
MRRLIAVSTILLPLAAGVQPGARDAQSQNALSNNATYIIDGGVEDKVTPDMCVTTSNPHPIDVSHACTDGGARCWPTSWIIGVQKAATTSVGNALHQCGLSSMAYSRAEYGRCHKDVVCKETLHAPLDVRTSSGMTAFTKLYSSTYCCNPNSDKPCPDPRPRKACETRHFISAQPLRAVLRVAKNQYDRFGVAIGASDKSQLASMDEFDEFTDPESSNNIANIVNAMPHTLLPTVRFVLILREPVSRMLSWYNHELEDAKTASSMARSDVQGKPFDEYAHYQVAPRDKWNNNYGVGDATDMSVSDLDTFHKMLMRHTNASHFPGMRQSLRTVPAMVSDQPSFSKGVYITFLLFFEYHSRLSRKQLMVVSMDTLVEQPQDMMRRITSHYGLPILTHMHRLIKTNERDSMDRVVQPQCKTRDFLQAAYAPFNEKLYEKLRHDYASKASPTDEPEFAKFDLEKSVPCTHGPRALTAADLTAREVAAITPAQRRARAP